MKTSLTQRHGLIPGVDLMTFLNFQMILLCYNESRITNKKISLNLHSLWLNQVGQGIGKIIRKLKENYAFSLLYSVLFMVE